MIRGIDCVSKALSGEFALFLYCIGTLKRILVSRVVPFLFKSFDLSTLRDKKVNFDFVCFFFLSLFLKLLSYSKFRLTHITFSILLTCISCPSLR